MVGVFITTVATVFLPAKLATWCDALWSFCQIHTDFSISISVTVEALFNSIASLSFHELHQIPLPNWLCRVVETPLAL